MRLKQFQCIAAIFFISCYFYTLKAQNTSASSKWTPEDIINTRYMRSVSFSPNNNLVVWTQQKAVKKKDKFVSNIYLTRLNLQDEGVFKTIQLTNLDENDYSPIFSKDGEDIYFLSSREKGKKLWKMSIYGGEPKAVKEFKNGISNIQWKTNNTLLFISNEGETLREKELKDKKDNTIVVEDSLHWKPQRIYAYNLKTKSLQRVTQNTKPVGTYTVSPNGNWLIYSVNRSRSYASDAQKDPFYYLQNLVTGKTIQLLQSFQFPAYSFQFSNNSKGFYFISATASDPEWNGAGISELYYYDIEKKQVSKVNLKWKYGIGRGFTVVENDVLVTLANRAYYTLAYYTKSGNHWRKSTMDLGEMTNHVLPLSVSKNGKKIIYQYSTASKLPKFYISDLSKKTFLNTSEVVKLNKNLANKTITKSEVFIWKGYNNEEVTGILYYPTDYQKGKKYPLILSIHGGPAGVDTDTWSERWSTYPNILAQRGAFVLKPNYHGSSNHGLSYVESIKGNYYIPELEDITKGIKALEKRGFIDTDKMGTMGWSNGAILTTMLTVKYPTMFKFAAPGAGDVNWTSDFGTCRFGVSFDQSYFGGAPWDDVDGKFYNENYIIKSPLFEIEKIQTPTIIFHGSNDRAVPRDQGWEYYRGLQQVGKTPVRFLWFPNQPHGLKKITHQLRKMKEELAWIDFYLFNKSSEKNEAFKKESPLATLLQKKNVKQIKTGVYGILFKEKLLPETAQIKKDSIEIGVFEVTNAQFKSYNPNYTYTSGKDNYPAVVSKSDAEAYVVWLSSFTQQKYRLPTSNEAKKLQEKAHKIGAKENTLQFWAGYNITFDEVSLLNQKIAHLNPYALLKEVGSFKGCTVGEATLYDLGGNVAEYSQEGSYGYSAYDYCDPNNSDSTVSKYVGIRVVKVLQK